MARYIDADLLWKALDIAHLFDEGNPRHIAQQVIEEQPTADVVSKKAYEQVKWERDTAIEQLKSYGVGFCENADVVKVKQGEWIKFSLGDFDFVNRYKCSECETDIVPFPNYISSFLYCFNCGAKMDGERKCNNG